MMSNEPLIEVRGVRFAYGRGLPDVLRGVDLEVARGEFVALLGQNGAGKTTLAKMLNGINKPTAGSVVVGGREVAKAKLADIAKVVGYCYQNPDHQIFSSSVEKEVAFGPIHLGYPSDDIPSMVDRALDVVGIGDLRQAHPFSLGRGQRQLVAVASILATDPPVLVIDEPTTGMDQVGSARIMTLLRQWAADGRTVVAITHDMDVVLEYIPRSVLLVEGQIAADGPSDTVFRDLAALRRAHLRAPAPIQISERLQPYGVVGARSIREAARNIRAAYVGGRYARRV